jgi:hypothetical protein
MRQGLCFGVCADHVGALMRRGLCRQGEAECISNECSIMHNPTDRTVRDVQPLHLKQSAALSTNTIRHCRVLFVCCAGAW